jgi:hypothetical protein
MLLSSDDHPEEYLAKCGNIQNMAKKKKKKKRKRI